MSETTPTRKIHQRVEPRRTPKISVKSSSLFVASTLSADIIPRNENMVMGLVRVRKKVEIKVFPMFFLYVLCTLV